MLTREPRLQTGRRLAKLAALFVLVVAAALAPAPDARAAERLSLGEVSTSVTRPGVDVSALLRTLAREELRAVEVSTVPRRKGAIVSVALVRMDSESNDKGSASTCVVSIALRDPRRGVLIALLGGRARAEDGARAATSWSGARCRHRFEARCHGSRRRSRTSV